MNSNHSPFRKLHRTLQGSLTKLLATAVVTTAVCLATCGSAAAQNTCIPNLTGPGGIAYPLADWRVIGNGKLPQIYAYALLDDIVSVRVEDGTAFDLAPNDIQITLVTPALWQKEIAAWNLCSGNMPSKSITAPGAAEVSGLDGKWRVSMKITKSTSPATAQTIVLRKAKLFGAMWDMYHFDPTNFWALWGGKSVTIEWVDDQQFNGPLPPCVSMLGCVPIGAVFAPGPLADRVVFHPVGDFTFDANGGPVRLNWGQPGDVPVRGFYDADKLIDLAVWRPSTGVWWIINSSDGLVTPRPPLGQTGDIPVPADYDGDGRTDPAVWRPITSTNPRVRFLQGVWLVRRSSDNTLLTMSFGDNSDVKVPADYDKDGKADFAFWRPSNGVWYFIKSSDGILVTQQFGQSGDIPVPGDYDGDGRIDLAVFRPANGTWYISRSSDGTVITRVFGQSGDIPVPGDYDHDLVTDRAVWRPSTGEWFVLSSATGLVRVRIIGSSGDVPITPSPRLP